MQFTELARGIYLEGLCLGDDRLWVSDPVKGGILEVASTGEIRRLLPEKMWIGSIMLHAENILIVSGEGGLMWLDPQTEANGWLLDTVEGRPLPGVNEMCPDGQGGIYFGGLDVASIIRGEQTSPVSLYHMDADGYVREVRTSLRFSNGMAIGPDGKQLYHNETFVGTSAFDILPDGSLGDPVFLMEKPDCDGMAMCEDGNFLVTGCWSSELLCLSPEGAVLESMALPGGGVTNVRLGGPDGKDLYIVTVADGVADQIAQGILPEKEESVLYRSRSAVAGLKQVRPRFPVPR